MMPEHSENISGNATLLSGNLKDANREIGDPDANREIGEVKKAAQESGVPKATQESGVPKAAQESGVPEIGDPESGVPVPGGSDPDPGTGWHSRGYLPHIDKVAAVQHVTFHLADSLPREVVDRMQEEIQNLPLEKQEEERRKRINEWIDAGHGSCLLREPVVAEMVKNAFLFFEGQRYRLLAWVVMPNHVHVLFRPLNGWSVAKIVASWKKFTARKIGDYCRSDNRVTDTSGIWHREYWDRYIRNDRHFQQVMAYIHLNPVKVGLVARAEEWPWSSASVGAQGANREIGDPKATQESGDPGNGDPGGLGGTRADGEIPFLEVTGEKV